MSHKPQSPMRLVTLKDAIELANMPRPLCTLSRASLEEIASCLLVALKDVRDNHEDLVNWPKVHAAIARAEGRQP